MAVRTRGGNVKTDRDTFGPRLRIERERRGITLKSIAEATKIKESQFVELERNDFSKWPHGIFRRAHLCAYVSAIGLPPQPVLTEYLRLFPDPEDQPDEVEVKAATDGCRAEQTANPKPFAPPPVDRTWVVIFDLAAVCLMSSTLAAAMDVNLWPVTAFVAVVYSAIGSACFARSIGTYVQQRIHPISQVRSQPQTALRTPLREAQPAAPKPTPIRFSHVDTSREPEVEAHRASA